MTVDEKDLLRLSDRIIQVERDVDRANDLLNKLLVFEDRQVHMHQRIDKAFGEIGDVRRDLHELQRQSPINTLVQRGLFAVLGIVALVLLGAAIRIVFKL
jgi:hypothetical protein